MLEIFVLQPDDPDYLRIYKIGEREYAKLKYIYPELEKYGLEKFDKRFFKIPRTPRLETTIEYLTEFALLNSSSCARKLQSLVFPCGVKHRYGKKRISNHKN